MTFIQHEAQKLPPKFGKPAKHRKYGDLGVSDLLRQRDGLKGLPLSMQKYIAGQRVLTALIGHEHSPLTVAQHPKIVYRLLREHGMTWDTKHNIWRFRYTRKSTK